MVCHATFKNNMVLGYFQMTLKKKELIQISNGKSVKMGPNESMSKSKKMVTRRNYKELWFNSARWFMLSDSPPDRDINWSDAGIHGSWRFCQKVWSTIVENIEILKDQKIDLLVNVYNQNSNELLQKTYQSLDAVTTSIERFQMNVGVAKIYELINHISKFRASDDEKKALKFV